MKIMSIALFVASSALILSSCGKNEGRTSGQGAGIETPMQGEVKKKSENNLNLTIQLQNTFDKKAEMMIPGYRILGAVATATLPRALQQLDTGSAVGTLSFTYEVKKFDLAYLNTIGEPKVSSESVPTAFKAFLFSDPRDSKQTLVAAMAGQPDSAFLNSDEAIQIQFGGVQKCSLAYVPRRDRDQIPDQICSCNPKTEICSVKHVIRFIDGMHEVLESKAIWDIVRDYPGSECRERKLDFTQSEQRNNTRRAVRIEIELYRSLLSQEAAKLQMQL